ncbi:type II toxin-antitoxin system VapB family antitoxin [Actinoallomurus rhizosphaericola]|uniref:type II toxin-antitoxin system VapB family antitoxin n=1 Tax=Actinoallomurus rhizosphaericola TaxID=2952536 RepID=UPI0020915BF2|nr:type II toxin-antitoxin system VapB family antitoxin [Actinoallomurus rhizosphaericola]MCO5993991.1 type II toxin-antitoxin system VapB family antitoxin [Actinoallomurus rhizosphaericola]
MTKILVDVDDDALAAAAEVLGTRTKRDTVNTALRDTVAILRNAREVGVPCHPAERQDEGA